MSNIKILVLPNKTKDVKYNCKTFALDKCPTIINCNGYNPNGDGCAIVTVPEPGTGTKPNQ